MFQTKRNDSLKYKKTPFELKQKLFASLILYFVTFQRPGFLRWPNPVKDFFRI